MSNPSNPATTESARLHAERIRSAGQDSEQARPAAGQSTAERYAERALEQARADEELRAGARLRELQARGIISADEDVDAEVDAEVDDEEEFEEEDLEPEDEEEKQPSTAERYAAVELERRKAEHEANLVAQRGAVRTIGPVGHRYAAQAAQPHRYADRWQKPAS